MIPSHVLLFLLCLYSITIVSALIVEYIGKNHYSNNSNEIWDISWKYFPDYHNSQILIHVIPILLLTSLFFIRKSDSILYEFLLKFIIILLLRMLTTLSTIFPKDERCDDEIYWLTPLNGCYDKVFSGHTAFVALFTLIFWREKIIDSSTFWLLNLVQMVTILLTRAHFTVDVVLGFVITYLVYDGNYNILGKKF